MIECDKKGTLFVLSGPSVVGKNTLIDQFLKRNPDVHYSISATTRRPRKHEKDGSNYYFLTEEKFKAMLERGEFLEWAEFCNNLYGTPLKPIEKMLNSGIDVVMDIEIQGAKQVKDKLKEAVLVFLIPPSLAELKSRIQNRQTETEQEINARLRQALVEMDVGRMYDYYLVHDNTENTVLELEAIRQAETQKIRRINWDKVIDSLKEGFNA